MTKHMILTDLFRLLHNYVRLWNVCWIPEMSENIIFIACGSFNPPTPMHFRMFGEWLCLFTFVFDNNLQLIKCIE